MTLHVIYVILIVHKAVWQHNPKANIWSNQDWPLFCTLMYLYVLCEMFKVVHFMYIKHDIRYVCRLLYLLTKLIYITSTSISSQNSKGIVHVTIPRLFEVMSSLYVQLSLPFGVEHENDPIPNWLDQVFNIDNVHVCTPCVICTLHMYYTWVWRSIRYTAPNSFQLICVNFGVCTLMSCLLNVIVCWPRSTPVSLKT